MVFWLKSDIARATNWSYCKYTNEKFKDTVVVFNEYVNICVLHWCDGKITRGNTTIYQFGQYA